MVCSSCHCIVIAPKEQNLPYLFFCDITDKNGIPLQPELSFLSPNFKYKATIYRDAANAHFKTNDAAYIIENRTVNNKTKLSCNLRRAAERPSNLTLIKPFAAASVVKKKDIYLAIRFMLKGRKFILILVLGITSFLLLLSVSIPISFHTRAQVPFSLTKTMEQFTAAKQLGKWFLPFADVDTSMFSAAQLPLTALVASNAELRVISAKPGTVYLSFSAWGTERDYRFLVSRDQKKTNRCIVSMAISNTIWKRMIDPDKIDDLVMRSLKNLENFTGSTSLFYGYPILTKTVTDSNYLYLSTVVEPIKKARGAGILFDSLYRYAQKNKLSGSGTRIFSSKAVSSKELRIFAGIAISGTIKSNAANGITLKKMSVGKTLLVADYKGKYKDIGIAYKALEQYKRDYQLTGVEIPFEEYISPGNCYEPNDSVSVKVCYPIF
jgi:effector-binding domain-containing protein